jgi:hypothetical protein
MLQKYTLLVCTPDIPVCRIFSRNGIETPTFAEAFPLSNAQRFLYIKPEPNMDVEKLVIA